MAPSDWFRIWEEKHDVDLVLDSLLGSDKEEFLRELKKVDFNKGKKGIEDWYQNKELGKVAE